jgi:dienelactone hydrolase
LIDLDAGVIFYGIPPLEYLNLSKIQVPFIAHWAKLDEWYVGCVCPHLFYHQKEITYYV